MKPYEHDEYYEEEEIEEDHESGKYEMEMYYWEDHDYRDPRTAANDPDQYEDDPFDEW
jgi:hypothetical protein